MNSGRFSWRGDGIKTKPLYIFGAGTLSGKELTNAQSYYALTVMRLRLDNSGSISSALVNPYRLRDDWLDWETIVPEEIEF